MALNSPNREHLIRRLTEAARAARAVRDQAAAHEALQRARSDAPAATSQSPAPLGSVKPGQP